MSYAERYLQEASEIIRRLDTTAIEKVASLLAQIKAGGGRVFFLGVGGSAANCSHAVNDFRKIAGMECYAPTDMMNRASLADSLLTLSHSAKTVSQPSSLVRAVSSATLSVGA